MNLLILDYGSGNIKSVYNSLKFVLNKITNKHKIIVSNSINDILIILQWIDYAKNNNDSSYKKLY